MGWRITKDHITEKETKAEIEKMMQDTAEAQARAADRGDEAAVRTLKREMQALRNRYNTLGENRHQVGKGYGALLEKEVPFRLYDDDGVLYFEGVISKDWLEGSADHAFAPLDWATAEYGCTEMKYKNNGRWEWETL